MHILLTLVFSVCLFVVVVLFSILHSPPSMRLHLLFPLIHFIAIICVTLVFGAYITMYLVTILMALLLYFPHWLHSMAKQLRLCSDSAIFRCDFFFYLVRFCLWIAVQTKLTKNT